MPKATLTSKYQITLPSAVRRRLSVGRGDRVQFSELPDGGFCVRKVEEAARSDGAARRLLGGRRVVLSDAAVRAAVAAGARAAVGRGRAS